MNDAASSLYGREYYTSHCGPIPYDRTHPHWANFFGRVADEIIRTFRPTKVFDAGCAHGFLVEALWDRGVETWGRDISEFAISQVRSDIRPYCSVGSLTDPIEGRFDLVTCIEVLEHMTEADGMLAIANMTCAADRVVFSSSPDDFDEPTHINVKPAMYWMRAFAEHSFLPSIRVSLPSITPYAIALERAEERPNPEYLVACAEAVRGRVTMDADYHAKGALTARIGQMEADLSTSAARIAEADQRMDEIVRRIAERDRQVAEMDQRLAERDRQVAEMDQRLAERDRQIAETNQVIAERIRWIAELDEAVVQARSEVEDLNRRLQHASDQLEIEQGGNSRSQTTIFSLQQQLADMNEAAQDALAKWEAVRMERDAIATSTTWRLSAPIRSAARMLPVPVRRVMRRGLKLAYWSATLQLGEQIRRRRGTPSLPPLPPTLPAEVVALPSVPAAASAPICAVLEDGLDPDYYLRENPDVVANQLDPLYHYLRYGKAEGRFPNAAAAASAKTMRLQDLCDPTQDEPGPRESDEAFRVSVLTPTYNTDPRYLRELFQSLLNQRYANWEWVIADDGSTRPETLLTLRSIAAADSRVRLTFNPRNLGISGASNAALAVVSGTHVALVDHDDLVARDAFLVAYGAWKAQPATQLFYTDECKLEPDGMLRQFWPKPDWSPSYLENTMCVGHLTIYEAAFLRSLGGFRSEYDGTQDFDLMLRAAAENPRVVHLPVFAYIWRVIPGSAATDLNEKHYAVERQGRAVLDYARRVRPDATVVPGWGAGYWRIRYPLPSPVPLLSYVIPTGGRSRPVRGTHVDLVLNCIRSLRERLFYPNAEYVVIHNGDLTEGQLKALGEVPELRLVHYDAAAFNFSEKLNLGVSAARGEYLCLLNDDVEVITERGGEELVSYLAANPSVGVIGPKCLYEDGTIQQNGILLTAFGPAHAGDRQPTNFGGHQAMLRCRREAFCIGGAAMFVRRDAYVGAGGFDEKLPLNYNDVDFGLRLREAGLRCVVDPDVEVYHFESATKIGTSTVEQERFFLKHPSVTDPYFSRWFDQEKTTYWLKLKQKRDLLPFGSWLDRHIAQRSADAVNPTRGPRLSVCVSVYNQPKRLLEEMYVSAMMQTYLNKEIVILDNGSSNPETLEWMARVGAEGRAVIARAEENLGIEGGNRRLLEMMSGDFFVAMDADDFLSVDALQVMADAILRHPGRKMFYSDEYKSNMASTRFSPFFKPDFDPILLTNCCYPAHLMVMEAAFLREIGAYTDPRAAWCHDYDTLTRALATGHEPVHVRELVYAWRINPGSTASAETFGKPETVDSQKFVLDRLLAARGLAGEVSVTPITLESSRGMWRLQATQALDDVRVFSADDVWGESGLGVSRLAAEAEARWIAILLDPEDRDALLELSAPARFDPRVIAVGGQLVEADGTVRWSGGLFLPGGRLLEPYAGRSFSTGGYHGLLWCQRCTDVLAPVNVLIRADAVARAAGRPGVRDADTLMVALGLEAQERGEYVVVTPHLRAPAPPSSLVSLPLDRAGLLVNQPALAGGSRWYDARLETDRPYAMPGMA